MPRIEVITEVRAPIAIVFDLSRSIDAHQATQTSHNERAIAGRTSGLIELHEDVTWEATHFGVRQKLTSRIVQMDRPRHFRDSRVRGAFKRFDHDHFFESTSRDGTKMRDLFDYSSPLGFLGKIADTLFLCAYMRRLLEERNEIIKRIAESGDYAKYLSNSPTA
jgi:ligand-binding SRPBCC domain-containing protein